MKKKENPRTEVEKEWQWVKTQQGEVGSDQLYKGTEKEHVWTKWGWWGKGESWAEIIGFFIFDDDEE